MKNCQEEYDDVTMNSYSPADLGAPPMGYTPKVAAQTGAFANVMQNLGGSPAVAELAELKLVEDSQFLESGSSPNL